MNQESTSNNNTQDTPGALLKAAKNQSELSSEQVATRLNLTVELILSIEDDDYKESISPAFYRGYLRSYAQLVGVDADQLIDLYNEIIHQDSLSASITPTFDTNLYTKKERNYPYFKWIIYFLVAVFVIYAGYYLWDKKFKSSESPQTEINLTSETNSNPSEIKLSGLEPEQDATQTTSDLSSDLSANSEQPQVSENESQSEENKNNLTSQPVIETAILQMDFSGDCWVKVTDANGEVLAIGIKRTGKNMSLEGLAPFKVILGNAAVVSMSYNQQSINLSAFAAGNRVELTVSADSELLQ